MGRAHRTILAGALYHIFSRGNDRDPIVLDVADRVRWVRLLMKACEKHAIWCHIYCLMTTHYHLLLETAEPNLDECMHWLNHVYAKSFNRRHGRRDHLFGRRYGDVLITSEEQLVETVQYIAMNPVRAKLCGHPLEWPWSNFGELLHVAAGSQSGLPEEIRQLVHSGAQLALTQPRGLS